MSTFTEDFDLNLEFENGEKVSLHVEATSAMAAVQGLHQLGQEEYLWALTQRLLLGHEEAEDGTVPL